MNTFYYAQDSNGEYLFDNFPSGLYSLIDNYKDSLQPVKIEFEGKIADARIGVKRNSFGQIYVLTTESKYINRLKLFKELLNISILSLAPISKLKDNIIEKQRSRTNQLIHNITSLNTYSIQDLFALIPQHTLSDSINNQKETIKSIISSKPNVTVDTLLKLIKYNLMMKIEFSVFERIQNPNLYTKKISHSIRSLVLSILQIFIDDFEKKDIIVSLDAGTASERRLEIDDDSLLVSLFYLLENSLKYCCPKTKYKIIFEEDSDCFSILFKMISIRIEDNEIKKLTNFGYRSEIAKRINSIGQGIGMNRITKTLKLNNAELEIIPRENNYTRTINGIIYEGNLFKIKFNGQKKWFG